MVFEPFRGGWAEVEAKFLRSRTLANGRERQHFWLYLGPLGPLLNYVESTLAIPGHGRSRQGTFILEESFKEPFFRDFE
jgi:hypothetical protein